MKITYNHIEENIRIFEEARKNLPIIQKFINGDVSIHSLSSSGLSQFGNFYDFIKQNKSVGIDIIMKDMTWKKLKPLLINNTDNERFKTYLSNRTQNKFNEILSNPIVYDRLLNGRWIRKPSKRRSGRRSDERISAFSTCQIAIVNYMILNNIDFHDKIIGQNWFLSSKLSLDDTKFNEMSETENLLNSISLVISESKIDFKKLNLDYISNFIGEKLKKLMYIEKGELLKCVKTTYTPSNEQSLINGNNYIVESSIIRNGQLYVYVKNNLDRVDFYPFSNFEDIKHRRSNILNILGL